MQGTVSAAIFLCTCQAWNPAFYFILSTKLALASLRGGWHNPPDRWIGVGDDVTEPDTGVSPDYQSDISGKANLRGIEKDDDNRAAKERAVFVCRLDIN